VAEAATPRWTEDAILAVENGDERRPSTIEELFNLVSRHLRRVRRLVENDDFSYRALLRRAPREREIQLWTASSLRLISRGLYSLVRENVVDDDKEVDISAVADGVGRVPIEIKVVDKYSTRKLMRCIEDQLLGRYMQPRDVRYGILLAVRSTKTKWKLGHKSGGFLDLKQALRAHASEVGARHDKVIRLETIDLVARPGDRGAATQD
jgi:hypothetical protein